MQDKLEKFCFFPPVSNQQKEKENEKYLYSVQYNLNKNAASYLKPYNYFSFDKILQEFLVCTQHCAMS